MQHTVLLEEEKPDLKRHTHTPVCEIGGWTVQILQTGDLLLPSRRHSW